MPDKIKKLWERVRFPFSRAAASIRRKVENSAPIKPSPPIPWERVSWGDTVFRSGVMLYLSLILNFAYGAVQFLVGLYAKSVWLGALSAYQILLAAMQFHLSNYVNKHYVDRDDSVQWKQYRLSACPR